MLRLIVVSIQGIFLEKNIDFLRFSGPAGQVGILKDHAALMTSVLEGPVYYQEHGKNLKFYTLGGILEVCDNHIVLLADTCSSQPLEKKPRFFLENAFVQDKVKKKSFHDLYSELSRHFLDPKAIKGAGDYMK